MINIGFFDFLKKKPTKSDWPAQTEFQGEMAPPPGFQQQDPYSSQQQYQQQYSDQYQEQYPQYAESQNSAYPPTDSTPTEQVLAMRNQGLSDNQIIQTLQRNGYDSTKILDALNQAEAKGAVGAGPVPGMGSAKPEKPMSHDEEGFEQIAESIVEEKFQEHMKDLSNIAEWKDKTDEKLAGIEKSIENIQTDMNSLHKAIVGKISEYDKNLLDVGTEIKAMEKVFKKVLPEFTQNVNELSRVTKSIKKK